MVRWKIGFAIAVLLAAAALLETTVAQVATTVSQKVSPQPPKEAQAPDKLELGEQDVKELLRLMDTDKNGKISKAEWMKFMSEEFDRLDKDKSGELDPEELKQSRVNVSHEFTRVGK